MKDYSEKLIETKALDNGVTVSLYDFCKPIAADRWYVKIVCRLELALSPQLLTTTELSDVDRELLLERAGGVLCHEFAKERNFVDENEKAAVVSGLIASMYENSLSYVANPVFAENLLRQKVEEFRKEMEVRRQMVVESPEEDDDGPADLSACFRD